MSQNKLLLAPKAPALLYCTCPVEPAGEPPPPPVAFSVLPENDKFVPSDILATSPDTVRPM
ncbi:MAG: hypothetical protein EBZ77_14270, partial [Chitinophagia bacterium]|nr:hypothetical protein [Chitinophagia bacterium]